MTKKGTLWMIYEAENQVIVGLHELKKDAEAAIEDRLRQAGHEHEKLSVHEVPAR